jgi:endonuclease YncB( thermonuclease family)
MTPMRGLLLALAFFGIATAAAADPCEAIPEDGPLPDYLGFGATFSGPVVRVLDGDSMCVAVGEGPDHWVEVRLADIYAPELSEPGGLAAKKALTGIALGRQAICVAGGRTHDRIAARCTIEARRLGDSLRAAGVAEGGRGMKSAAFPTRGRKAVQPVPSGAFRTCAEAWKAGAAPVRRGEPGYNPNLDGDHDGVACEPLRGRR